MADGIWKGVYPLVFGYSTFAKLFLFHLSTPSMRKVDNKEILGRTIMTEIVATNVIAS